jgi:DNA repair exonuclease SbcCD ATPase subunit
MFKRDVSLNQALADEESGFGSITDGKTADVFAQIAAIREKIAFEEVQIKALELALLDKPDFNAFAAIVTQLAKDMADFRHERKATEDEFKKYKDIEFAMVDAFNAASIKMAGDVAHANKDFDKHLTDLRYQVQKEYRELGTVTPALTRQIQELRTQLETHDDVITHMRQEEGPYLSKIETLNKGLDNKVQRLDAELVPLREAAQKEEDTFKNIEELLNTADAASKATNEQLGKTRERLQEEESDLETSMTGIQGRMQHLEEVVANETVTVAEQTELLRHREKDIGDLEKRDLDQRVADREFAAEDRIMGSRLKIATRVENDAAAEMAGNAVKVTLAEKLVSAADRLALANTGEAELSETQLASQSEEVEQYSSTLSDFEHSHKVAIADVTTQQRKASQQLNLLDQKSDAEKDEEERSLDDIEGMLRRGKGMKGAATQVAGLFGAVCMWAMAMA